MELLFCIKHGEMVVVHTCPVGTCVIGHEFTVKDEEYPFFEVDFCEFELGWATCQPPEVPTIEQIALDTVLSQEEGELQ